MAANIYRKPVLILIPAAGAVCFTILYLVAAQLYPGGSQVDAHSQGFSWINNYWCNLLNEKAMNGQRNPARPLALAGMVVLCISLSTFWYVFPKHVKFKKWGRVAIQMSGLLSMVFAMLLFTNLHDAAINVAGFFGVIALAGTFTGLYRLKWPRLLYLGIFNLLLVALNNYVYYASDMIIYLPVIQKISFASFLIWISWIDIKLFLMFGLNSPR